MEQNVINFFAKQKFMFSKIYILYILHIYVYVYKSFSTILDKGLRNNTNIRDREIGKPKLNEMGTQNMK